MLNITTMASLLGRRLSVPQGSCETFVCLRFIPMMRSFSAVLEGSILIVCEVLRYCGCERGWNDKSW